MKCGWCAVNECVERWLIALNDEQAALGSEIFSGVGDTPCLCCSPVNSRDLENCLCLTAFKGHILTLHGLLN